MDGRPSPGSEEALAMGCTCPVLDNCHGEGLPLDGKQVWWISQKCPIHGAEEEDE